jgi:hemolysin activation/secretion protein
MTIPVLSAGSGVPFLLSRLLRIRALLFWVSVCLPLGLLVSLAHASGLEPACNGQSEELGNLPSSTQCPTVTSVDPAVGARSQWVTIAQFRFTGNTLFTSKALAEVLADDLNRPLNFGNLQALSEKVEGFYRAHGRLAIVVLPAQDMSANKLTFVVVEAKPGKLHMEARLDLDASANRLS